MSTSWAALLIRPRRFFRTFDMQSAEWSVAYTGYWSVAFVEAVSDLALADSPAHPATIVVQGLFRSLLGSFTQLLVFGIVWIYLGSKILGGKATFGASVLAVGYAFLFPGALGLVTVPIMLLPTIGETGLIARGTAVCIALPIQLLVGAWSLANAVLAASQLNSSGKWKTVGIVVWYPLGLGALLLGLVVLFKGCTGLTQVFPGQG